LPEVIGRCYFELETVSIIAKLLQNRQHAQTHNLGQIWLATVGQWSMLTGLISSGSVYCVASAGKKPLNYHNFHIFLREVGSFCPSPLPIQGKFYRKQQTADPRSMLTFQISFESVCCITFQGRKTAI